MNQGKNLEREHCFFHWQCYLIVIFFFVCVWFLISFFVLPIVPLSFSYVFSLFFITFLLSFLVLFLRRFGIAFLFLFIGSFVTYSLPDVGLEGFQKIALFIFAGVVFEIAVFILKFEIKSIPLDVFLGTAIFSFSLPLITTFLLSGLYLSSLVTNLALLSLFVGVLAFSVAFFIWHHFKNTRLFVRFSL